MQRQLIFALGVIFGLSVGPAGAQEIPHSGHHQNHVSPYAGLETREIKGLSEEDVEALREGRGWGLALPAELNGVPGPVHLLKLKNELGLSADQVTAIETMHAEMRAEAIAVGEQFMAAEAALDAAFAAGGLHDERLRHLIQATEAARAELRFIHLSRHLSTPLLLTRDQVRHYSELRGYGSEVCLQPAGAHCH